MSDRNYHTSTRPPWPIPPKPSAAPAAPRPTEMVERVAEAVGNELWPHHGTILTPSAKQDIARAIIALLGPHFRNEQREADAKIADEFIGSTTVASIIAAAIRASKEPT